MGERVSAATHRASVAAIGFAAAAITAGAVSHDPATVTPAVLALVGSTDRFDGVSGLVGGLVGGAVLGGVIGYALVAFVPGVLSLQAGVGLGTALGGGIGVVSNLLATDDGTEADSEPESMTVDMDSDDEAPSPRPADLFDDHPDPVLYVADEGHGPVVRAANDAFEETFDVAATAVSGAPLEEALLTDDETADLVASVAADESVDTLLSCQTPEGDVPFRVRSAGGGADGYLVFTPRDD